MASFSEKLKSMNAACEPMVMKSNISKPSDVGVMTLSLEDESIAAYVGDMIEETELFEKVDNPLYLWIEDYKDPNYSHIDTFKNVTIDNTQVNLTQEENSQVIPFELDRYYDGIDLSQMTFQIYYINPNGNEGLSTPINVTRSANKIRFFWLIDGGVTAIEGEINFEIRAEGTVYYTANDGSPAAKKYKWKTKPNADLQILKSLAGNGAIEPSVGWDTYLQQVSNLVAEASGSATAARQAATDAQKAIAEVDSKIDNASTGIADQTYNKVMTAMETEMSNYYTKEETYSKEEIDAIDVTEKLGDYALKTDIPTNVSEFANDAGYLTEHQSLDGYAKETYVQNYVQEEIEKVDVSEQLVDYAKSADVYTKEEVDTAIEKVEVDLTGYATETYVNDKVSPLRIDIDTNAGNIQTINTTITSINQVLESIDKSPNAYYETTYNEPYTFNGTEYTGENTLAVYEVYYRGTENETRTVVSAHVITGGSGGTVSSNTIKIERVTSSPLVVTADDKVEIEYNFIGTDASGDDIGQGNVTWKLGNRVIKTENVYTGINKADLTEFFNVGSDQKLTLIITDDIGTMQQKTWYVSVVDVKLESVFDDTRKYTANSPVAFTYTPYGALDKTVHFLLDGEEIATKTSTKAAAGLSDSYSVPAQSHGTHLFEIYMTATINNNDVESNHIVKDIIWYDETSNVPVIATTQQTFTARQYEATNIKYTVYDSSTETPIVTLKATYINEDGETVETYNSSVTMTTNTDVWQFKTDVIGEHTLTITCKDVVKTLKATVTELGIDVNPTTAGLEFDFNPVGYSNNDENRIWSDKNTGVSMTVSDNFDWVNGGYQIDEAGDQYFCVKAGTTATINYNLFNDDAKEIGKEFKAIFKTSNVKKRDTSFITCMNGGIGLDMKVESANIYSSNGSLYSPYCEEDVIEFEFNINKSADIPLVLTYEDGVGNRPMIYTSDSSFWQTEAQPITIGCDSCDVYIYRMKAYSTSLSDKDILNNFIADARSAEEMIKRYERNQIYKEGVLNPEYLAEKCPDLRIIMIDAPWFTNDKDNKVADTNITMIYKNGDPVLDNWTCTGATHRGRSACPLYMETYIYEARKKTGMLKCKSEWKAMFKSIVTCNAY